MNIDEAKRISIQAFLEKMGCKPVRIYGKNLLYHSPLRIDRHPSFLVEIDKNLWHDNGTDQWGDIIELASRLWNLSVSDALSRLDTDIFHSPNTTKYAMTSSMSALPMLPNDFSSNKSHSELIGRIMNVQVIPLRSVALLSYLRSRRIDLEIGRRYCREIHYDLYGKHYFAIAFQNSSGCYEVRNPYFKGCFGKKDITLLPLVTRQRQDSCLVFEGFMDFLSYQTLLTKGETYFTVEEPSDLLIMNSVNNRQKYYPVLERYGNIHCFLDNDTAGRKAVEDLNLMFSYRITDDSFRYADYKDINDYLIGRKK